MASPKELVGVVADVMGLAEGTVILHDRNLLAAGLRSQGQRGRGTSRVTSRDAARLLIGIAGAHSVKDTVNAVERQGQMRHGAGAWSIPFLPIPELSALPVGHTLVEALSALIDAGVSGSLTAAASEAYGAEVDLARDSEVGVVIRVVIGNPVPTGRIMIALIEETSDGGFVESTVDREERRYNLTSGGVGNISHLYRPTYDELHADLTSEHTFTHRSIMRVAELLGRDASD